MKYRLDFTGNSQVFVLLRTLCNFSNQTVFQSLQDFQQTKLVTTQLITHEIFDVQINSAINDFKLTTINNFLRFLQIQNNISFINQIITGKFKNTMYVLNSSNSSNPIPFISPRMYNNSEYMCSCANDSSCRVMLGVYKYYGKPTTPLYIVPGMYGACSNMNSFVISTLECFYDNTDCVDQLTILYNNTKFNITQLNSSPNASRFATNTTMGDLLSQLFIESWDASSNYSSYFDQCQPVLCTYKISRRNNALEIVTRVTALIGGLSISLQIIVRLLATVLAYLKCRCQQHEVIQPSKKILEIETYELKCVKHYRLTMYCSVLDD